MGSFEPKIVRYDSPEAGDPYWEFIASDVPSVSCISSGGQFFAGEVLRDIGPRREVIGLRVYEGSMSNPVSDDLVAMDGLAKRKLDGLLERGWKVCGYAIRQDGDYGLVTDGALVGWFSVAERNAAAAEARADALAAQLAALSAERDAAQDVGLRAIKRSQESFRQAAALEAKLKAAREALEPFAEAAENLDDNHRDGSPIWETPAAMGIDARHLIAARAALNPKAPS